MGDKKPKQKKEEEANPQIVKIMEILETVINKQNDFIVEVGTKLDNMQKNIPMHRDATARDLPENQTAAAGAKLDKDIEDKGLFETKIRDLKAGEVADLIRAFSEYKHVSQPMTISALEQKFMDIGFSGFEAYAGDRMRIKAKTAEAGIK